MRAVRSAAASQWVFVPCMCAACSHQPRTGSGTPSSSGSPPPGCVRRIVGGLSQQRASPAEGVAPTPIAVTVGPGSATEAVGAGSWIAVGVYP